MNLPALSSFPAVMRVKSGELFLQASWRVHILSISDVTAVNIWEARGNVQIR